MEILRGRLFGVATSAKCAAPLERHFERRRLQNSSLLSLHRFVASAKASDRFGAAALGKNAFRVAARPGTRSFAHARALSSGAPLRAEPRQRKGRTLSPARFAATT